VVTGENTVTILNYNPATIYNINYLPNSYRYDPWTFKLSDYKKDVVRISETFKRGTAYNKTITLSNSPFIDLARIRDIEDYNPNTSSYRPIEVFLKNADIQGDNNTRIAEVQPYNPNVPNLTYTYNKTLYEDKSWSDMKDYKLTEPKYLGFDYYQWK